MTNSEDLVGKVLNLAGQLLCYAKALTQTMKGTKQIEDTKGGERKLKQCNSPKFLPSLQVPVSLLL
jgi:hypothetical protein